MRMQVHGKCTDTFVSMRAGFRTSVLTALCVGMLAGCASTTDLPPQEARIVAPVDAMIVPPPGGPGIINVVSTTLPNAIRQDISLATQARSTGENKITLIQFVSRGGDGSDAALKDIPFTEVNLTAEALAAWPNSGMSVSPYFVQNDYGPFGYAIGRPANGDVCIYAWQRIAPGLKPSGAVDRGTITVRFQMCKRGASEQELLEVMYRLRLKASVHQPRSAPQAIGRIAAPIRPVGAEGFSNVFDIPSAAPTPPSAPAAPAPTPVVIPAAITPPPGAPIVPSPSGSNTNQPGGSGVTVPRPTGSGIIVPRPGSGGQQT